ncbi:MAG: SGNH/GDSL hydrolase family protein [Clostridia bacterium]|nr:SGNH/GDSL hydrolase family protein [Clostridia bacterium]
MKKIISILLCAIFLLGILPTFSVFAGTGSVDLSSIADGGKYVDAKGNEYTVLKSAETIKATVTANMSANYILGNDIDFGGKQFWSYIFNDNNGTAFSGIFDGNGYSITNFFTTANYNAKVGLLFGGLSGNATVRDLTVGSETEKIRFSVSGTSATVVGGLAGYTVAGAKATVSNVDVYADISHESAVNQSVFVGGFIGQCDPLTLIDCNFYGSIKFTESAYVKDKVTIVGGIVARCNQEGEHMDIVNCNNYADIDVTQRPSTNANVDTLVGGIVGSSNYSFAIVNCENHGVIKGDRTAGGIVGKIVGQLDTAYSYEMIGCTNHGEVSAEMFAGGILGLSNPNSTSGASTRATYSVTIRNCLNTANVTAKTTQSDRIVSGLSCAGGIAGRLLRGYNTIENCGSTGNIAGNGRTGNAASTTNGIFGYLYVNADAERLSVISNCYATGSLTPYADNYSVYATGAVSTDKMTYIPFISNCHYSLTATKGTLKTIALSQSITEDYGDYKYKESGAVTADEVANGTLLAKLGDGFTQTIGTDAYPIPVREKYTLDGGMENLFSAGAAGYYGDGGTWVANESYSTKNNLTVKTGDVITVGALSAGQVSFGYLFDANKNPVKKLSLSDMTLVGDLGNGYGIYSYTVTEGTAYISVSVFSRRAYITLLTVNDTFDANTYYDYFGIQAMKGNSNSPLWQKSALFIGDSICYGFSDVAINGRLRSYAGRIAYDYDMEWVNAGVSGATLSTATEKLIVNQLDSYKEEKFDYVVIEGGINDALKGVELGTITEGFEQGLKTSTYAGALEFLFKTVTKTYPEAKVGFMITYECPRNQSHGTYITYQDITKQICEKWDIEYLDMFSNKEINETVLESSNTKSAYLPDGIHPSAVGYDRLYPYIASFMETLAVPAYGSGDDTDNNDKPETPPAGGDESDTQGIEDTTNTGEADTDTDTQAPEEKKKGCGSFVGAPIFLMAVISIGAIAISNKKNKFN